MFTSRCGVNPCIIQVNLDLSECLKSFTNLVFRERIKLTRVFGGCTSPAGAAERCLLNFLPGGGEYMS